jgi:hypothetical protein
MGSSSSSATKQLAGSPRPPRQLAAASEEAAGNFLIYLKDTLCKMENELSHVRLVVQKGVGQVQRERSYYRSSEISGGEGGGASSSSSSSSSNPAAPSHHHHKGVDALAPGLSAHLAALEQAHEAVLAATQAIPLFAAVAASSGDS